MKNGDKVKVFGSEIIGTIIGVCIRGVDNQTFEYNVTWWSGSDLVDKWLWAYQLELFVEVKRKAGMVNYEDDGVKRLS